MSQSDFSAPIDDRYFEDYRPGFEGVYGPVAVTEAEVLEFGRKFDPQDMHTDPEKAAARPVRRADRERLAHVGAADAALREPLPLEGREPREPRPGRAALVQAGAAGRRIAHSRTHSRGQPVALEAGPRHGADVGRGSQPERRGGDEPEGDEYPALPGSGMTPAPRYSPAHRDHGGAAHARQRLPVGPRPGLREHRPLHDRGGL